MTHCGQLVVRAIVLYGPRRGQEFLFSKIAFEVRNYDNNSVELRLVQYPIPNEVLYQQKIISLPKFCEN